MERMERVVLRVVRVFLKDEDGDDDGDAATRRGCDKLRNDVGEP